MFLFHSESNARPTLQEDLTRTMTGERLRAMGGHDDHVRARAVHIAEALNRGFIRTLIRVQNAGHARRENAFRERATREARIGDEKREATFVADHKADLSVRMPWKGHRDDRAIANQVNATAKWRKLRGQVDFGIGVDGTRPLLKVSWEKPRKKRRGDRTQTAQMPDAVPRLTHKPIIRARKHGDRSNVIRMKMRNDHGANIRRLKTSTCEARDREFVVGDRDTRDQCIQLRGKDSRLFFETMRIPRVEEDWANRWVLDQREHCRKANVPKRSASMGEGIEGLARTGLKKRQARKAHDRFPFHPRAKRRNGSSRITAAR